MQKNSKEYKKTHGVCPEPVVWDADFDPGIPQRIANIPVHCVLSVGTGFVKVVRRPSVECPSLATSVQLLHKHGCWAVEGMLLKTLQSVSATRPERVTTNGFRLHQVDARQLVADGLPLNHGAQVALDTTLVSPLMGRDATHSVCRGRRCGIDTRPAVGKSDRTLSFRVPKGGPGWSCWPARWAANGYPKRKQSSGKLPRQGLAMFLLYAPAPHCWLWKWNSILAQCPRLRTVSSVGRTCHCWRDGPTEDSRYACFA